MTGVQTCALPISYLTTDVDHNLVLLDADGSAPNDGRWFSGAIGRWLVAGDYWIAFNLNDTDLQIAYDTSGSDLRHGAAAGQRGVDWGFSNAGWSASADSTKDYSIRGNTIR